MFNYSTIIASGLFEQYEHNLASAILLDWIKSYESTVINKCQYNEFVSRFVWNYFKKTNFLNFPSMECDLFSTLSGHIYCNKCGNENFIIILCIYKYARQGAERELYINETIDYVVRLDNTYKYIRESDVLFHAVMNLLYDSGVDAFVKFHDYAVSDFELALRELQSNRLYDKINEKKHINLRVKYYLLKLISLFKNNDNIHISDVFVSLFKEAYAYQILDRIIRDIGFISNDYRLLKYILQNLDDSDLNIGQGDLYSKEHYSILNQFIK